MKRWLLLTFLLVLLSSIGYFVSQNRKPASHTAPTAQTFCAPSQLEATVQPSGAAGNIYAKITLKNISTTLCTVVGNNTVKVDYPISVTNFQVITKRQPATSTFTLAPNQTIFALLHFPNGPQCSGPTTGVDAGVSYAISPKDSVSFQPSVGPTIEIPSCQNSSEMTVIDVYPFSDKEVMP